MLGFDETYHMENAVGNLRDNKLWLDALAAKFEGGEPFGKKEWDQLLGHCQVIIQRHRELLSSLRSLTRSSP